MRERIVDYNKNVSKQNYVAGYIRIFLEIPTKSVQNFLYWKTNKEMERKICARLNAGSIPLLWMGYDFCIGPESLL